MSTQVQTDYREYLAMKSQFSKGEGFVPSILPDWLFDFQGDLVERALSAGRFAIFADCGLGKTPMELAWAESVVRKSGGNVLIGAPLAVSYQIIREGEKFGIPVRRSIDGESHKGITVTNYERLHLFNPKDFVGFIGDESSVLKSFNGVRRNEITVFMRQMQYRLLSTATAAPNDYIELGTTSEALGYLGYMDMLSRFFKNDSNTIKPMVYRHKGQNFNALQEGSKWRFKGHAEQEFWRWVCSWSRAVRKPSDLGYDDSRFELPALIEEDHLVYTDNPPEGCLFALPAVGLAEQRDERKRTVTERCEKVAELVNGTGKQAFIGCHLNTEGDLLEKLIPDSVQVAGHDTDEHKEERLIAFADGKERVLITKDKIGAWGLNLQGCSHVTRFPSHSYEAYYQFVRRCWRFGQPNPVKVDIVTTEGDRDVLANLQRKAAQADRMFSSLVAAMNDSISIDRSTHFSQEATVPSWI